MNNDLEMELVEAHEVGLEKLGSNDEAIFSYKKKIYRTSLKRGKPKTKLICNVLAKLISADNKGTQNKPAYEYLFQVQGNHFDYTKESYFKPSNLTSNRTFTTKLMGMVPFGEFCGNKDEFAQFFMFEVDNL